MWTPHDIEVMLHHHCSTGPWPLGDTNAYRDSLAKLFLLGLIDRQDNLASSTDKGRALINLWCSQPVPVVQYVDPRCPADPADDALPVGGMGIVP